MDTSMKRYYDKYRRPHPNAWQGVTAALQKARFVTSPAYGPYGFLADYGAYGKRELEAEHLGFTIRVEFEDDDDYTLGDDDVTGTFSDERGDDSIRNRSGYRGEMWYHPSASRLEQISDRQWWPRGMTAGVHAEYARWQLAQDMIDDSDRRWIFIRVSISVAGHELVDRSLGGIDMGREDTEAEQYAIECARELLDEAFEELRDTSNHDSYRAILTGAIEAAKSRLATVENHAAALESALTQLSTEDN